jgi:hypothetical protein
MTELLFSPTDRSIRPRLVNVRVGELVEESIPLGLADMIGLRRECANGTHARM